MRVLIVDDEPKVRLHLIELIGVCGGYEIVGEACDGVEALRILDSAQPDIVITDIRMPGMNGLNLLEEIARHGHKVGRVILSGYGDFAYTQQAMRQGVQNYLLKPVDLDHLLSALERASQEVRQERMLAHQLQKGVIACRERWLVDLLHGRGTEEAEKNAVAYGLTLRDCTLFLLDVLKEDEDEQADWSAAWNALQSPVCVTAALERTRAACLMENCGSPERMASDLRNKLTARVGRTIVAYGEPITSFDKVRACYLEARKLLDARWLMQDSDILCSRRWLREDDASAWTSIDSWDHAPLDAAIETDNHGEIARQVEALFTVLEEAHSEPDTLRYLFVEDILRSMRGVLEHGGDAYEIIGERMNMEELFKHKNLEELRAWYTRLCIRIAAYDARIRSERPPCVSQRILALFAEDCSRNYSLQELAQTFYMSPTYLGQLFKKETGKTPHACLTEMRITRACQLLLRTDAPVYEIAEQLGYPNLRNFYVAFKKYAGCTPSQYREGERKT
ncbi:MAG: response regulator [Eubacteriales bacterium]|nr:response regulator [Eubacteriales bacterium]